MAALVDLAFCAAARASRRRRRRTLHACTPAQLHLVDLAGSERIKKTEITGRILQEGLAINLALHYLQQVCPHARRSAVRQL